MYICVCVSPCMQVLPEAREDVGQLGVGVLGGCDLSDMDAGNCSGVLWRATDALNHWIISLDTPNGFSKPSLATSLFQNLTSSPT